MVIDNYIKFVLTVIAIALVWLCVALPPISATVAAQSAPQRVVIVGWEERDTSGSILVGQRYVGQQGLPVRILPN